MIIELKKSNNYLHHLYYTVNITLYAIMGNYYLS